MVKTLENCCFCCNLKQGTITIGVIHTTVSFAMMVWFSKIAADLDSDDISTENDEKSNTGRLGCIVYAIFMAIHCILSVLLCFAVATNRSRFLLPWLIYYALHSFASLLLTIKNGSSVSFVIGYLLGLCLVVYQMWCVFSYYKELKSQEVPAPPNYNVYKDANTKEIVEV